MPKRKWGYVLGMIAVMLFLCSCNQKETEKLSSDRDDAKSVSYEEVKWTDEESVTEAGSYRYSLIKSGDNKYGWLIKVEVIGKGRPTSLDIPDEIGGIRVLRIGCEVPIPEDVSEISYNLFGSQIIEDRIMYRGGEDSFGAITEIKIPDTVQVIDGDSFAGLYGLKKVKLPQNLKQLGAGSFHACNNLASIEMGDNLERWEPFAFEGCESLSDIHIASDSNRYYVQGGFVLDREKKEAVMAIPAREELVLPKEADSFGKFCFLCSKVKTIELEEGNSTFEKDGACIYRSDSKALAVGIVKDGTASLSNEVEELNQDSLLAGENVKRIEMPSGLKYLRGEWMDMADMSGGKENEECTYVFFNEKVPKILERSERSSMVPLDGRVIVPKKALARYRKWFVKNGGAEKRISCR